MFQREGDGAAGIDCTRAALLSSVVDGAAAAGEDSSGESTVQ
jgi:hypothetical protein